MKESFNNPCIMYRKDTDKDRDNGKTIDECHNVNTFNRSVLRWTMSILLRTRHDGMCEYR